jgi:hypothetical protein
MDSALDHYREEAIAALDNHRIPEKEWKRIRSGIRDWRDKEREASVNKLSIAIAEEARDEANHVSESKAELTSTQIAAELHLAPIIDSHHERCYRYQRASWNRFCDFMNKRVDLRSGSKRWRLWFELGFFRYRVKDICQCSVPARLKGSIRLLPFRTV